MPSINPHLSVKKRKPRPLEYYLDGLAVGDRYVLGEAITLVESTSIADRTLAGQLLQETYYRDRNTMRIAVTGSPGVGKSTMVEALGKHYSAAGNKVAVLAIDPSSNKSRGSILGDKTRMTELSALDTAFIRPSAAGTTLGGITRYTKEALALCEAAGYTHIMVETVGVGQSETVVASMVDLVLLLLLPGAGDEVQGIKRGIMELADVLIVNKADPDRKTLTEDSLRSYRSAVSLLARSHPHWRPTVLPASALHQVGIGEIAQCISDYYTSAPDNYLLHCRQLQDVSWYQSHLQQALIDHLMRGDAQKRLTDMMCAKIADAVIDPFAAVDATIRQLLK